ncbi:CRISPR-associated endonuclease Cas2 [Endomicrobium proavitum]|uniref:CRISPR-associated endoribonuclease Cas2 n=1 Tax=Endomicrobium proavitum TaxID=1408281 RepID=A0A0G3WHX1_9BACT|nr:CRISPR-associated endonuclease Cas2 [Endomicrobium proavitum]AKL98281.1 CRISPR-associated protein Cas2 [Endomicrobium proavitum]
MEELTTLVFYDLRKEKLKIKLAEKCKDYGLKKMHKTGFCGKLSREKRERLKKDLSEIISDNKARLIIQTVCSRCLGEVFISDSTAKNKKTKEKPSAIHFGMKLNKAYLHDEN